MGGIIFMVNYIFDWYNGNWEKVYVMGFFSGGMMINVMVGFYFEVFEVGVVYFGIVYVCFVGMCNCFVFVFCLLWFGCCLLFLKVVLIS